MGIVRMGVPEDVALFVKNEFKVEDFIETGTFKGDTAVWASTHFANVMTIEFSEPIFKETTAKHGTIANIKFLFGDSRVELKKISDTLNRSGIFWLDAHWCGTNSYGKEDQCPLIDELNLLVKSGQEHFILIDDARLFESPPPLPNSVKFYPGLDEIISALGPDYYTCIFEDVIMCVPKSTKEAFVQFMQDKTTQSWRNYGAELKRQASVYALGRVRRTFLELRNIWFPHRAKK